VRVRVERAPGSAEALLQLQAYGSGDKVCLSLAFAMPILIISSIHGIDKACSLRTRVDGEHRGQKTRGMEEDWYINALRGYQP
jgi:hypothetical protein